MLKEQTEQPQITPNPTPLEKRTPSTKKNHPSGRSYLNRLDFIEENDFSGGSHTRRGFKLALWTWASAAVVHLLIIAATCVFLLTSSFILQSSLRFLFGNQNGALHMARTSFYLYLVISGTYFVMFRVFLGATIGEYSCGLRLGEPSERLRKSYALRILFRTVLILGTGIVTLPLISTLFKRDLAGRICGVSIYSLK